MKKKIGLIVLAVVLVLGIAGLIYYFMGDSMKTPKEQFWGSLGKDIETISKGNENINLKDMSFSQTGDFTMNMTMKSEEYANDEQAKRIIDGISKSKILFDISKAGNENKAKASINIQYDNQELLKFDFVKNDEKFGIKVDEIYSKYITIENKNLKALFNKFGVDTNNIPDKIEIMDIYEFINISKEDKDHIIGLYSKVIEENIPEEAYTVNKNVKTEMINGETNTTEYKLELTAEQTRNLGIKLLEATKNDETIINLLINKSEMILKMGRMFDDIPEITKEEIYESIDDSIEELNNEEIEGLKILSYKAGDLNKIVFAYGENELYTIMLEQKGNTTNIVTTSENEGINNKSMITINQINKNESKAEITTYIDSEYFAIEEKCNYTLKLNDNEVNIENFTDDNSVNVNEKTKEELQSLAQELYYNLIFVLPKKAQILGINLSELM